VDGRLHTRKSTRRESLARAPDPCSWLANFITVWLSGRRMRIRDIKSKENQAQLVIRRKKCIAWKVVALRRHSPRRSSLANHRLSPLHPFYTRFCDMLQDLEIQELALRFALRSYIPLYYCLSCFASLLQSYRRPFLYSHNTLHPYHRTSLSPRLPAMCRHTFVMALTVELGIESSCLDSTRRVEFRPEGALR
jgi:hypothetical protein